MIYSCNLLNVAYGDGTVVEMVTITRVGTGGGGNASGHGGCEVLQ